MSVVHLSHLVRQLCGKLTHQSKLYVSDSTNLFDTFTHDAPRIRITHRVDPTLRMSPSYLLITLSGECQATRVSLILCTTPPTPSCLVYIYFRCIFRYTPDFWPGTCSDFKDISRQKSTDIWGKFEKYVTYTWCSGTQRILFSDAHCYMCRIDVCDVGWVSNDRD